MKKTVSLGLAGVLVFAFALMGGAFSEYAYADLNTLITPESGDDDGTDSENRTNTYAAPMIGQDDALMCKDRKCQWKWDCDGPWPFDDWWCDWDPYNEAGHGCPGLSCYCPRPTQNGLRQGQLAEVNCKGNDHI